MREQRLSEEQAKKSREMENWSEEHLKGRIL
jgi:hypothetical protein